MLLLDYIFILHEEKTQHFQLPPMERSHHPGEADTGLDWHNFLTSYTSSQPGPCTWSPTLWPGMPQPHHGIGWGEWAVAVKACQGDGQVFSYTTYLPHSTRKAQENSQSENFLQIGHSHFFLLFRCVLFFFFFFLLFLFFFNFILFLNFTILY